MRPAPLVSIVIPVWKPKPEWFEAALRSVLDGEECALEVIVIDDGNDPPVALPVDDSRLSLIAIPHGGPYAARNAGLAVATGTHVRYIDSDDVVVAGSTTRLLDLIGDCDDLIAYGDTEMCDEMLRPTRRFVERLEGDAVSECLLGGFDVFHVSMLFPRAVVARVAEWDTEFRVSGDWDYVLRALEGASVVRLDEVVTRYRRHSSSVMSSARLDRGFEAHQRVIRRYAERHTPNVDRSLVRRAKGRLCIRTATAHAWRGERLPAIRIMSRGLVRTPGAALRASVQLLWKRVTRVDPTT